MFERRYSGVNFEPEDLAIELGWHVDYYDVIRGVKPHGSEPVEAALAKLRGLQTSTTYPLLLNLLHRGEEGSLSTEDLVRALELVSGFILRRYVCNESSRGYYLWFVTACRDLEGQTVEKLKTFFVSKGYPDDARFEQCLVRFPLYQSDYGRYVLEKLERSHEHREAPDLSQTQIEHIMPQTLNEEWKVALGPEYERIYLEWLHSLGNLTLSAYNKGLYNHAFRVKRKRYEQSNVALTRQLATNNAWGDVEIHTRDVNLARRATEIWIGP